MASGTQSCSDTAEQHALLAQHQEHDANSTEELQWASSGSKMAAVNYSEKVLEEKERRLVENIQKNYGRIKQVENELAALQLQLRMNVGPKKHALEMLRRKIEEQNERVKAAAAKRDATKKAFDEAAEALASEERAKEQLCQELNLLVRQSATSQLEKLEQLTRKLELLNSGIFMAEEAAHRAEQEPQSRVGQHSGNASQSGLAQATNGAAAAAAAAAAGGGGGQQAGAPPAYDPSNPFLAAPSNGASAEPQQPAQQAQQASPEALAAEQQRQREAAEQAQRAKLQAEEEQRRRQALAEAEAARSRHVALGQRPGLRTASQKQQQQQQDRKPVPVRSGGEGAGPGRPRAATDERGQFKGFD